MASPVLSTPSSDLLTSPGQGPPTSLVLAWQMAQCPFSLLLRVPPVSVKVGQDLSSGSLQLS